MGEGMSAVHEKAEEMVLKQLFLQEQVYIT